MSNLFSKAAVFTDIHLGLKNNSIKHLNDCEEFIDWFIDTAQKHNCETCLFLGDFHHHRVSINLQTLKYSLRCLEKINDSFENAYFIPGNHDLYYRDKRDIHGVEWAKHLPNIHIVNDWFLKDNVSIVPWLIGNDYKKLNKIKAKYMFGHFELPHFKLNSMITMPDTGTIQLDQLFGVNHVYSGHFHIRQFRNNVTYVGNAFPHNFTDAGDSDRGCMILEWDQEPRFFSWPNQPLYMVTTLTNLIDNGNSFLKPKMSIRVQLNINISYEEALFIKETFQNDYNLRDISLITAKNTEHENDTMKEISFTSVDNIISEQIASIKSEYYNSELLLDIYKIL